MSRLARTLLLLFSAASAYDAAREPNTICKACVGDIVHPANGEPTEIFVPCFEEVDRECSMDADALSFCNSWLNSDATPETATMSHVIAVEHFKLVSCAWTEAYKHEPTEEETLNAQAAEELADEIEAQRLKEAAAKLARQAERYSRAAQEKDAAARRAGSAANAEPPTALVAEEDEEQDAAPSAADEDAEASPAEAEGEPTPADEPDEEPTPAEDAVEEPQEAMDDEVYELPTDEDEETGVAQEL